MEGGLKNVLVAPRIPYTIYLSHSAILNADTEFDKNSRKGTQGRGYCEQNNGLSYPCLCFLSRFCLCRNGTQNPYS
jgi:hypothetical protein